MNNNENLTNITEIVKGDNVEFNGYEFIVSAIASHGDDETFICGSVKGAASISLILPNTTQVNKLS